MSKNQKIGGARYIGLALAVIALLAGIKSQANVFPSDAKTIFYTQDGIGVITLLPVTSPITILGVRIQQSGTASETTIYCGSVVLLHNYSKDYPQDLIQQICDSDIILDKTGQDTAFLSLTYVPYDIANRPNISNFGVSLASVSNTAPLTTFGFMTAGDILIALLLFGVIMLNLLTIFLRKI